MTDRMAICPPAVAVSGSAIRDEHHLADAFGTEEAEQMICRPSSPDVSQCRMCWENPVEILDDQRIGEAEQSSM